MSLKEIGEFGFIGTIQRGCVVRPHNVAVAIGDDAAAFTTPAGMLTLVTTDLLVEQVHFRRKATNGFDLGYKSLAVNLSDIAAMGGIPREAFVSIAIPDDCDLDYLEALYNGIKGLAAEHDVNLLGGDTTRAPRELVINIAVVGAVPTKEMLTRDRAEIGDRIYCSGYLGHSRAGLHLLGTGKISQDSSYEPLLDAHRRPRPQIAVGRFLGRYPGAKTAIDISDGLVADLGHVCRASKHGARLYEKNIPVSETLERFCRQFNFDPRQYALAGGEDYVLLFTIAEGSAGSFEDAYQREFGTKPHFIGEITAAREIVLIDVAGKVQPVEASGWDHFKSKGP